MTGAVPPHRGTYLLRSYDRAHERLAWGVVSTLDIAGAIAWGG
jgi:hypothetical protein